MAAMAPDDVTVHTIRTGDTAITFTLAFVVRRTLKITVYPDQQVCVEAPHGKPLEEALARVRRRTAWILRQRDYFRRFQPPPVPRRYLSGETHRYLGRQYRLKLIRSDSDQVKLTRGYFQVFLPDPRDADHVASLLDEWLLAHGRRVIESRIEGCLRAMRRFRIPAPERLIYRRMRRRWASCGHASKTILINRDLIQAPLPCIDYILTHELCHLKHPHHGPRFYRLLAQVMPDWQKRKERLETALL
jgi:predicted metal-dependent hydrolase